MRQPRTITHILSIVVGLAVAVIITPIGSASAAVHGHWQGHTVYVENHAPGWPIKAAAEDLDNYNGLNLVVVRHCPKDAQCIRVYNKKHLPGRAIGVTRTWGNDYIVGASVELETSWRRHATYRERRALACHEIGHAIGLNHHRGHTCMNAQIGRHTSPTIKRAERRQLRRWY